MSPHMVYLVVGSANRGEDPAVHVPGKKVAGVDLVTMVLGGFWGSCDHGHPS